MPRIPGLLERTQQPLYDTATIFPELDYCQFFQVPLARLKYDEKCCKKTCPLCRDGIRETPLHQRQICIGCNTTYHAHCISEMGGCATLGCSQKGVTRLPRAHEANKTLTETNMEQGGCLPYPKNFEIHSIGITFEDIENQKALRDFKENSYFRLFIGTKDYLIMPTKLLCMHCEEPRTRSYVLAEPIDLIPQQNFYAGLYYTGKQIQDSFRAVCCLHGFFKREVH